MNGRRSRFQRKVQCRMKRLLDFDGSPRARERSLLIHQSLFVSPALVKDANRSVDTARHLMKLLDKLEACSVETADDYGEGTKARAIVGRVSIALTTPEWDLVVKYMEGMVQFAKTSKLRALIDTFDWVKAAPSEETKD